MSMKELSHPGLSPALSQDARDSSDRPSGTFGDVIKRVFNLSPKPEDPQSESKEPIKVVGFRPVKESDYPRILEWLSDPETLGHLSPKPQLPEDWTDKDQVDKTLYKLHEYYINFNPDLKSAEPENIMALVAANEKDKPLGVLTIRWRGDPWMPKGHKIASIERVVVNPKIQRRGIGTQLIEKALGVIFDERDYQEVRAWIMTDEIAGNWQKNFEFFNKFGFDRFPHPDSDYEKYCKKRGIVDPEGRTKAWWLSLKKEGWEAYKEKNLQPTQPEFLPLSGQDQ